MKAIIKELFGLEAKNRLVYDFKPGYRTVIDREQMSFDKWCKEFRVSMLHGKDVKHFN